MLNYTAFDFETANSYRGSPCAVALVRVRDGLVVDERRWLIRPPQGFDHFDGFNVGLHGITPEAVADAAKWSDVAPALGEYIGDDIAVAHNAAFDTSVIRYACEAAGIEWPKLRFVCTLAMTRHRLRLPSYRLPFVASALGIEMGAHHDPVADARAAAGIVHALATSEQVTDIETLAKCVNVRVGQMWSSESYGRGSYTGSISTLAGPGTGLVKPQANPEADPDGYLYGRVVVFTGALMSMTRQQAWQACARLGATPEQNTTKRTNVLVVGEIDPSHLRPDSEITGKARRAFELQDKGQDIEVMTEDDFLRCLDGRPINDIQELLG